MEDSSSSKPFMVTSSLNFKVTTPSFYNQPKKFASVAPPRPKSVTPPSAPSPTPVGTGVIGRVGDLPPPPSTLCDDFPPPPPPPLDDDLPAPPPECQTTPSSSDAPPPAFPAPPPVADDLPLPAPPEESACLPTSPSPPPPPPPPPLPTSSTSIPSAAVNSQRLYEKQTSFDKQLDSLTDLLSEMETRGPFNPKLPNQYSSAPAPKPSAPPPTAPKPTLSFLPPPEMGDRPPPAPWAEELKARTNRQANHNSATNSAAQPFAKAPAVAPKSGFNGRPTTSSASLAQKLNQNLNQASTPIGGAPKPSSLSNTSSFPPVPMAPPAAPTAQPNHTAPVPALNHMKSSPFAGQVNANLNPPSSVPPPQPKAMASPPSSFNQPMKTPPSSTQPSPPGPIAIPGGGVPLNMREVEELERMTKDFIKDMDTHAPVITSTPSEVCGKCGEALSRTQPAVRAMDKLFHSNCFCCMSCHRPLQGMQFYDRDGAPQCEDCYMSSLAVCSRCGEKITDRVLKAVGQCFHAHCFRCSTCSCVLEGAPFITDDNNNPYCVQDYHRRFSPLCVSCNEPIIPAPGSEETVRVVALDKNFHLKCYRCELQISVQPSSQSEPDSQFQPPIQFNLPEPQDQQNQLQPDQQSPESNPEYQHQAKSIVKNHQRLLLLLLGFSICAAIVGVLYYMHQNLQNRRNNLADTETPCVSPACQRASAHLSMSADPFKQPCDYFLFTCGSNRHSADNGGRQRGKGIPGHPQNKNAKAVWPERGERNKVREDKGLREEKTLDRKTTLLQFLKEILESNDTHGGTAVQKAKRFYRSCLDTKSIETAGAEPFLTLIQKLGGWAVSGQWDQTDFNTTLSLLMRNYNTFPFFNVYVGKDPNETLHGTAKRYIQIDQPDLLIPIEWNSKTQKSQAKTQTLRPFLASCQRYLDLLGAPPSSIMIHVGMFISLSSEFAVAAAPLHYRLSKGQLHQRMTIKQLQSQAPAIDWLGCLQATFHPVPLTEDDHVLLHNLPYIVHMSHIIVKWMNRQELSTSPLHTYMFLNLLHALMPALDSRFSETARNLSMSLGNTDGVTHRWKHCVLDTEIGFDLVLTDLLSQRTAHKEAEEIIQNIFSSFKSKLHEFKWTDQETHQLVMKRVQSLKPRLWTTKEDPGEAELDLLYSQVMVTTNSFFSNYIQLLSIWQKRRTKLLTQQTEAPDILSVTPILLGDSVLFPMGMFVPPLFDPTYPRAMNYGVMGFIMAKDILHMLLPDISPQGEMVHAVAECVWAHYLTAAENAGRGGVFALSVVQQQEVWVQYSALQTALQAYHHSLMNHPKDTSIAGLSHIRLFLTSFSQLKCDSDPYREFMPLEPSFLITVFCATSDLCPTSLQCPNETQRHSLQAC